MSECRPLFFPTRASSGQYRPNSVNSLAEVEMKAVESRPNRGQSRPIWGKFGRIRPMFARSRQNRSRFRLNAGRLRQTTGRFRAKPVGVGLESSTLGPMSSNSGQAVGVTRSHARELQMPRRRSPTSRALAGEVKDLERQRRRATDRVSRGRLSREVWRLAHRLAGTASTGLVGRSPEPISGTIACRSGERDTS